MTGPTPPSRSQALNDDDQAWANLFTQVLAWRDGNRKVNILNMSIGYSGIINGYRRADLRANLGDTIAVLAQDGSTDKAILVWSAGNAHGDSCEPGVEHCEGGVVNAVSPNVLAGLVRRIPELRGHSIAVAALSPAGEDRQLLQSVRHRRRLLHRGAG